MSHDQKPARVRVVRNAATPPLRRRGDPPVASVVIDQAADAPASGDDAVAASNADGPSLRTVALGTALVLVAAAGAGFGVALLAQP